MTYYRCAWLIFAVWPVAAVRGDESARNPIEVCVVNNSLIREASGIAASRTTKNAVWIHNDSGDKPRLFQVSLNGSTLGIINVNGAEAADWEDLCSFEMDGVSWLLVGDIGDNGRVRGKTSPPCRLYLLKEPTIKPAISPNAVTESTVEVIRTTEFQFPDGPHDCESLAVDSVARTVLLVTKSDPFSSGLYSLPLTLTNGHESLIANKIAPLSVTYATAMDASSDGRRLVIVSMFGGVMLTRDNTKNESWADASLNSVTVLKLPQRKQGESVCFTLDGNSLLLNSEGVSQPLWRLNLDMSP